MSGEIEAAGAMATAGLAAGVIEGRESGRGGEGPCLNCGVQLSGRYCANCGQAAIPYRSLVHVFQEIIHGVFNIDTKVWRTLPMVVGRPGTLTRNYIYGKRARYLSPMALFLFCVFLMFFAFSFVESPIRPDTTLGSNRADAVQELSDARRELAQAQQELAQANPDADMPAGLEMRLARQAIALAQAEVTLRQRALERVDQMEAARQAGSAPPAGAPEVNAPAADASKPAPGAAAPAPEESQTWQEQLREEARAGDSGIDLGSPALTQRVRRALENPDLVLYKIQDAASKYSFLLAPISLPFIALLFLWKRGLTLYDHVVFALYSLSFASLLFIAVVVAVETPWLGWAVPFLLGLGLPVHTYFHLKGAYALGWWSALWRSLFMLIFALISLAIFVVIIFFMGLLG